MIRLLPAVCLLLSLSSGLPFERSYGTAADDRGVAVVAFDDGGCILVANSDSSPNFSQILVVRVDGAGDTVWTRTVPEPGGMLAATGAVSDGAGGCFIVGKRKVERVDWDMYAVRLDSSGRTAWSGYWGSPDADDIATGVCRADTGWVVCGYTLASGEANVRLDRLTALGAHPWILISGSNRPEYAYSVARSPDGSFLVAGAVYRDSSRFTDVLLMKVDSLGTLLWSRTFGDSLWDEARAVVQMANGDIGVVGFSSSYGQGNDCYFLRTNSAGQGIWSRTYGFAGSDRAYSACEASGGGLVAVGERFPFSGGSSDLYMLKVSGSGALAWDRFYGRAGNDCGYSVVTTPDSGFLIAGSTWNDSSGNFDAYLVKTTADGTLGVSGQPVVRMRSGPTITPNPFTTSVRIAGCAAGIAPARVFSSEGRLVAELARPANGPFVWDGRNSTGPQARPGVYYLETGQGTPVKLVKTQ
jgi:hypothetical protein